jgi:hypothetical protein
MAARYGAENDGYRLARAVSLGEPVPTLRQSLAAASAGFGRGVTLQVAVGSLRPLVFSAQFLHAGPNCRKIVHRMGSAHLSSHPFGRVLVALACGPSERPAYGG